MVDQAVAEMDMVQVLQVDLILKQQETVILLQQILLKVFQVEQEMLVQDQEIIKVAAVVELVKPVKMVVLHRQKDQEKVVMDHQVQLQDQMLHMVAVVEVEEIVLHQSHQDQEALEVEELVECQEELLQLQQQVQLTLEAVVEVELILQTQLKQVGQEL
jgi:hypothetical protein